MKLRNPALKATALALLAAMSTGLVACAPDSSDKVQRVAQETMLKEATAQTGMPAITSFSERKHLKRILELRDKTNYVTYTYTLVPGTGERKFLCKSLGYGIPYATQYTSPQKPEVHYGDTVVVPQADPNGLFSPESADATWVICVNPAGGEPAVIMEENRITVSPFPLPR